MRTTQVSVIGLGYIGLPTAAVIASRGLKVCGVDVSSETVDTVNRGEVHIVEPDLDIVVRSAVMTKSLRATLTPEPSDVFIVAVPTPFAADHQPDLSHIQRAAQAIAPVLKTGDLVILESTSPVGATEKLCEWIAEARTDLRLPHVHGEGADVAVAHCPERVLPGNILKELVDNDRIIGGITRQCAMRARDLYDIFVKGDCILTTARTARPARKPGARRLPRSRLIPSIPRRRARSSLRIRGPFSRCAKFRPTARKANEWIVLHAMLLGIRPCASCAAGLLNTR